MMNNAWNHENVTVPVDSIWRYPSRDSFLASYLGSSPPAVACLSFAVLKTTFCSYCVSLLQTSTLKSYIFHTPYLTNHRAGNPSHFKLQASNFPTVFSYVSDISVVPGLVANTQFAQRVKSPQTTSSPARPAKL
ncbi:hypothetical protein ACKAV7_013341 [Fusarium commune]